MNKINIERNNKSLIKLVHSRAIDSGRDGIQTCDFKPYSAEQVGRAVQRLQKDKLIFVGGQPGKQKHYYAFADFAPPHPVDGVRANKCPGPALQTGPGVVTKKTLKIVMKAPPGRYSPGPDFVPQFAKIGHYSEPATSCAARAL